MEAFGPCSGRSFCHAIWRLELAGRATTYVLERGDSDEFSSGLVAVLIVLQIMHFSTSRLLLVCQLAALDAHVDTYYSLDDGRTHSASSDKKGGTLDDYVKDFVDDLLDDPL